MDVGPQAILRQDFVSAVEMHAAQLDEAIIHARDRGFYLSVVATLRCPPVANRPPAILYRRCISIICSAAMAQ